MEVVGILFVDEYTICWISGDIDVNCDSNDFEDFHRIKDRTIIKFSSPRKSSELLNKKKKLKKIDTRKYVLNNGSRIYFNESLRLYHRGLWGKCKDLWQDKVAAPFYNINAFCELKNLSMINSLLYLTMTIYGSSVSRNNH